jgi:excisionase family DNA binding protein
MVVIDGEEFLDGNEACKLLGIKSATLYAYVSRGIIQSYKQGIKRQRLYKRAEIEGLLTVRPSNEEPDKVVLEKKEKEEKPHIPAAEDWIPYF